MDRNIPLLLFVDGLGMILWTWKKCVLLTRGASFFERGWLYRGCPVRGWRGAYLAVHRARGVTCSGCCNCGFMLFSKNWVSFLFSYNPLHNPIVKHFHYGMVLFGFYSYFHRFLPQSSLPLIIPRGTEVFSFLFPRSLRFFFPLLRNAKKNLSASSSRVSNSGLRSIKERASYIYYDHRSISTAPYLTASVTSVTSKPASPFLSIKPTP